MTHRDRAGDAAGQRAGRREAAGDAGHRQGFPTPSPIRPLPVRLRDRNGGFPRLSDGPWLSDGAHVVTEDGSVTHRPGEACKLAAGTLHSEQTGADGATILLAKK